ncbi:MAG: histidine--tRNA ligase [Clostridiales bacterium]|nr:histidine--tRNA ligase [Clostridiales bacterium]
MKITSVKGTNDYLPEEAALRDRLQATILRTYTNCGFEHIITPALEDGENLDKSEGGENLNLIFRIMKRGDKLANALSEGRFDELSDIGLRYDLTLPLCRFYAAHRSKLPTPAKLIQIDRVYRAERPQKGRDREFVQCDIDIIGSDSICCEIELIATTAKALRAINIGNFRIRINDRAILRGVLAKTGFDPKDFDSVCVTFDKLDKIGVAGVTAELTEKGFDAATIDAFRSFLDACPVSLDDIVSFGGDPDAVERIKTIKTAVEKISGGAYSVDFDVSLVRGQGYYTGTVFEVESTEFSGAIGGGGRYDNLIEKFTGEHVPAVGFSIGFERIFSILRERYANVKESSERKKITVICEPDTFADAYIYADTLRGEYDVSLALRAKKFGKQLARLEESGVAGYVVYGENNIVMFQ